MDIITKEMKEHFRYRTGYHLWCVHKWSNKILQLKDSRIDANDFIKERDCHDELKWLEPEYTPYLLISWRYKCKRDGIEFILPEDIKEKMHEATFHHIKNHRHHPEFWDDSVTICSLNKEDRDSPSAGKIVDGTKMPLTYVATMCADWFAMSEELGGEPEDWAKANVGIRWKFSEAQVELINSLIGRVWPSDPPRR